MVLWKWNGASRCVPLWVDSVTFSTAQPSPSGRSSFFRPGRRARSGDRVLVGEVLDLGLEGGRIGDDIVLQVDGQIDEAARHGGIPVCVGECGCGRAQCAATGSSAAAVLPAGSSTTAAAITNTPPQAAMLGPKPKVADIEPSSSGAKAEMPRPTLKRSPRPRAAGGKQFREVRAHQSGEGHEESKYRPQPQQQQVIRGLHVERQQQAGADQRQDQGLFLPTRSAI